MGEMVDGGPPSVGLGIGGSGGTVHMWNNGVLLADQCAIHEVRHPAIK